MTRKIDASFLTCMQACDTITLLTGMDFNNLIANSVEFTDACAVVLGTRLTELPECMAEPIAKLQYEIIELLGIEVYENLNSSSRSPLFHV